jgi:ABC-type multidrug transport system ATPase subunit
MMTGVNAIEVENLTKRFGNFTAVDHIDFKVEAGELFGFLGPNGAGKTTTVRRIAGVIKPTVAPTLIAESSSKPRVGFRLRRLSSMLLSAC